MAQYVFTMNRLGKIVPPKREILKDISLSFFPGAKIGVLGLNGSGKSTLLRIMAGVDTEFDGEARPMPGIKIGYLPQEPELDPAKTVRDIVEEAVGEIKEAQARLDAGYAAYAEPDADFDALAAEQAKLEAILQASDGHNLERQLEVAADALRLPRLEHAPGLAVTFDLVDHSPSLAARQEREARLLPLAGAVGIVFVGSTAVVSGAAHHGDERDVERLRSSASWFVPAVADAPVAAVWRGVRARRPSGTPVIRRLRAGVTLFGALGGRGFLCGPLLAQRLAERLADRAADR